MCEMMQNSKKIRTYSSSRSFRVIFQLETKLPRLIYSLTDIQVFTVTTTNYVYILSQKKQEKLFLPQRRQIYSNSDNFWQKDGKQCKMI